MSDSQQPLNKPAQSARQWAMFCHLSAFVGVIFPFGNLLGPLILWQLKRESDPFIDAQGKEALNFQITVAIAAMVSILLMVVVIGFPLLLLVGIGALVLTIIAGIKANEGLDYRYPFTWRLLK
ncbi:MAG: orotate phosphoribosyltransferase [Pseudomonas sp.]|nr:orotate phosphoribosyltransferase [Pseudomonas sp.]